MYVCVYVCMYVCMYVCTKHAFRLLVKTILCTNCLPCDIETPSVRQSNLTTLLQSHVERLLTVFSRIEQFH